ncbi:hypothetical protein [Lentzea sp. CC55]|nr:hypothetical protein [Lentzea sp. CC55]
MASPGHGCLVGHGWTPDALLKACDGGLEKAPAGRLAAHSPPARA